MRFLRNNEYAFCHNAPTIFYDLLYLSWAIKLSNNTIDGINKENCCTTNASGDVFLTVQDDCLSASPASVKQITENFIF
jgi:hypothetical protein